MVPGHGTRRERLLTSITAVGQHENRLRARIETALAGSPATTLWSRARRRTPTLLATFEGHPTSDISAHLADHRVNAPSGSFYAYEAARTLGLGPSGGLRIGLAPYNDDADVDRLADALSSYFTQNPGPR